MAEQRSQEFLAIGHSLDRIERIAKPGARLTLGQARMVAVECESARCAAGTLEARARAAARELDGYGARLAAERVRLAGLTLDELRRVAREEGVASHSGKTKAKVAEMIAKKRMEGR